VKNKLIHVIKIMKTWARTISLLLSLCLIFIPQWLNAEKRLNISSQFKNPQEVYINGIPDGAEGSPLSIEEPFISRDGQFLFFNSGEKENHKDLHYAEWINNRWLYKGEIGPNINTIKEVEGNPTMDKNYNFFYIDSGIKSMARVARFSPDNGKLSSVRELEGIPKRKILLFKQKVYGNIGVEVSANGSHLFFSRATWDLNGFKLGTFIDSDIHFLKKQNGRYVYNETEERNIMKNINTSDLEYAASISADGLELFFTRLEIEDLKKGNIRSKIMCSTRGDIFKPFGVPKIIETIGASDFVEGPAISGDEKELYYHKREGNKNRLFKVTR
jgi:hypothetical protein